MLRLIALLVGVLTLLILLAACRGGSASSSGDSGQRLIPTPTVPTATPVPVPTNTPTPSEAASGTFPLPTNAVPTAVAIAATGTAPTPSTEPSPTPTPEPLASEEDVNEIRQIVQAYWAALNDYDVDLAITMLEPGYRETEEELIRRDIGRMKLFRVKLGVSEETPPALNADGDYETFLSLKTPVDTRRAHMIFRKIDGQWWIIYSKQVE